MRSTVIAILKVVIGTGLGLLSNIVANKIQPHILKRTRLLVIIFSILLGAALVLAVTSVYQPAVSDKAPISDNLNITSIKTVEDSDTDIQTIGDQGVISVNWELLLSNLGD